MPQFPVLAAGQKATAAMLQSMEFLVVEKVADLGRINNTQTNDPDLFFNVVNGGKYFIGGLVIFNGAASAANITFGWTAPASSVLNYNFMGQPTSATTVSGPVVTNAKGLPNLASLGTIGTTTDLVATLTGRFTAGATGVLQLQWAQTATNATATTLRAGSALWMLRYA